MNKFIYSLSLIIALCFTAHSMAFAQKYKKGKKTTVIIKPTLKLPHKSRPKPISSKKVIYKKPSRKVVTVRSLPNRVVVRHKGINYYYANHRFYTYSRGHYVVIPPRVGFRIPKLPTGYIRIKHPRHRYFWFNGIFYVNVNNEYEVVEPEVGTIIYELPNDYERVEVNGETYYEYNNILYEKVQVDGTKAYEVTGSIEQ